ncbi:MAG: YceI family protein [Sphingorhabdus sp.]
MSPLWGTAIIRISAKPATASVFLLTALLIAAAPLLAFGSAHFYRIDSAASNAHAKVAFMGLSSKTARFPKISGNISLNPARLRQISLNVNIDARALKAGGGITEKRLKGKDFFYVARYPTVRFTGKTLTMTSAKTGRVSGRLTARGVTRPVTLMVKFSSPPAQASGKENILLTATTVINRRNFGMTAYSGVVGKKVTIAVKARMLPR